MSQRIDLWMPAYIASAPARAVARRERANRLTHVMFLVCDHFEPRHGIRDPRQAQERMQSWHAGYARLQARCRDAFGHVPLHTFFYPPHHGEEHLSELARWAYEGFGEVELHYHHQNDTSATLQRDLQGVLDLYNRWGLLLESGISPRRNFGFVHGDWALCNSLNGRHCGVNDEIPILQELGCWGDFTMPSNNSAQPRKVNSIYYAVDHPGKPKSYNRGRDARVGVPFEPGLFMMQGPLGINWRSAGHPRIEQASLTTENWGRPDRIRTWIDCNVHVRGRPEWLFVKLHCHGAIEQDFDGIFGERAFEMHRILNEHYNDHRHWRLHYVTARQAYNIARAAQSGKTGDPSEWKDFEIGPQASALYSVDAPHRLTRCTANSLQIDDIVDGGAIDIQTRIGPIRRISGPLSAIDIDGSRCTINTAAAGEVSLETAEGALPCAECRTPPLLPREREGHWHLVCDGSDRIVLNFDRRSAPEHKTFGAECEAS